MKELIQLLSRNKKTWILALGIILLPFNKLIFTSYPNFYLGKFNFFQTSSILIGEIALLIGCLIILISKLINLDIKKASFLPYAFFLWILILTPSFHLLVTITLLTTFLQLKSSERKIIIYAFIATVGIQSILGLLQFILQSDLGLQFLGEPSISSDIKGIAKVRLKNFVLFRSYGTLPHPNLLAAFIALAALNFPNKLKKYSFVLYLGLISSLSISATYINTFLEGFKAITQKKVILLILVFSIISTITVSSIRIQDTKKESLTERIEQIQEVSSEKPNTQELLLGFQSNKLQLNKKMPWEITPTHNIYLLTFQVYGLIGLALLLLMLSYSIYKNPVNGLFLSFMFLTDHFWLTLPQGLILIVIALTLFQKNQDSQEQKQLAS